MECPANFAVVDPGVLWRGARPDVPGMAWLSAQGVKTIINLELLHGDAPPAGVTYITLPDFEPVAAVDPALEDTHIRRVLAAIATTPKPAYIHCRDGQNRTGVAVAAYRIIDKNDPVDAVVADMLSYKGLWAEADERYIRGLAARRAEFSPPVRMG